VQLIHVDPRWSGPDAPRAGLCRKPHTASPVKVESGYCDQIFNKCPETAATHVP
jgi:hypothetical protein